MIDVYEQFFNELNTFIQDYLVSSKCSNELRGKRVKIRTEFETSTTTFPYITIGSKGNTYADRELDIQEKHSSLVFDINIYDNSVNKRKICSELSLVTNEYMSGKMGLIRTTSEPFPNVQDTRIYRILQRFEGFIDCETGVITKNIL